MSNNTQNEDLSLTPMAMTFASLIFIAVTVGMVQRSGPRILTESSGFVIGALGLLSLLGLTFVFWQMKNEFTENGPNEAINWFLNHEFGGSSASSTRDQDSIDKVAPPTEKKKNRLKFERANRQCEFCEEPSDHLEIHHIKPRAEGGSNKLRNLIALCPECHRKADSGAYSRSELTYHVRRNMNRLEGV